MSIESPFPDVDIPDQTLHEFLFGSITDDDMAKAALVDAASGMVTSYAALLTQADAVAGGLAADGLAVGDVVALHSPNSPMFAAVFHGVLLAGGTLTTVGALATADDIAKQLNVSGASYLITVAGLYDQAKEAAARAGIPDDRLIVLDGATGHTSFDDLVTANRPVPDIIIDPATHIAVLPYSSGTTGLPKGVMLTHRNLVANLAQSEAGLGVRADDVCLAVLPFYHIYGMVAVLNMALLKRASLVTFARFDLERALAAIQRWRLTYLFVAPPIVVALAKSPLVDDYDTSSVRIVLSGAAPLDGDVAQAVADRLNARVFQGYGMSELSPVSHLVPWDRTDIPASSVGLPVANTTNKLVDVTTGEELSLPETGLSSPGELLVKGPNVMAGYLSDPDATAQTIDQDGYLHTGDIAVVDANGAIYIVDRLKELIKYKGYQVPPAELEAVLLGHPLIRDAAVIGVPDDDGGEIPKAYVVAETPTLDDTEVMSWVAERVAPYKKARAVEFIEAVPKSPSGKILRRELRRQP